MGLCYCVQSVLRCPKFVQHNMFLYEIKILLLGRFCTSQSCNIDTCIMSILSHLDSHQPPGKYFHPFRYWFHPGYYSFLQSSEGNFPLLYSPLLIVAWKQTLGNLHFLSIRTINRYCKASESLGLCSIIRLPHMISIDFSIDLPSIHWR